MKKTIKLVVTVQIEYPKESDMDNAINRAKECVLAQRIWGSISVNPLSAKIQENKL